MKDYIEITKKIITPLLDDSNSLDVSVMPTSNENELRILIVAQELQIPRLIGKEGRNANAIRQLVRAAASLEGKKIVVDFEAF